MTWKDLRKRVSETATTTTTVAQQQQSRLFERLHNKPFWIWDVQEHRKADVANSGACCFNHIIGRKNGTHRPMYDYEKAIFAAQSYVGSLQNVT